MLKKDAFQRLNVTLAFLILTCYVSGQDFKKPLNLPVKYLKPTEETQNNTSISSDYSIKYWRVWIDKEGVVTKSGKKTSFLEEFYVVEESATSVHIVKDKGGFNIIDEIFEVTPIDYGWVRKSDVILWESSLYNSKTMFREKVLTITDPNNMQQQISRIDRGEKLLAYYNSPTASETNNIETQLFEVFYVYKNAGNRSLIGIGESLYRTSASSVIMGWVDNSMIQSWGDRQTLEPNTDRSAVMERKNKMVTASVFDQFDQAIAFSKDPTYSSGAFWKNDKYEQGYATNWKRLPILSNKNGVLETAVISQLITVSSKEGQLSAKQYSNDDLLIIKQLYNEQADRAGNINIVFAIDGTRSMEKPIESVKKAVDATARRLSNSANKFKFGAVIYRDYTSSNDESCFETLSLGDHVDFETFLAGVNTNDPKCFNNTVSEGMYKGVYKACKLFNGKQRETNIIILVGDAGDRSESWRIGGSDVIKELERYRVSLIAMQAHNYKGREYNDFIMQVSELAVNSSMSLSKNLESQYGSLDLTGVDYRPRLEQDQLGNRQMYEMVNSPIIGALQVAEKRSEIPEEVIESEVSRIIQEIDSSNNSLLNSLSLMISNFGRTDTFSVEALEVLSKAGFSQDQIELLSRKKYQFLLRGYTTNKIEGLKEPLYAYKLFIDGDELNLLIKQLSELSDTRNSASERRTKLYSTWVRILTINYGANIEELENRSLAEIMGLLTGIASTSELLLKYKLSDINDPKAMHATEIDGIINYIKMKSDRLMRVARNPNYYFKSNRRAYYWIDQKDMP